MERSTLRNRVFELDALRGFALFMMILHHFIFDLRYLFGLDVFAFQESWWFIQLLRPLFLNVFLVVSGICCSFSRSNHRRGLRLLAVALALTALSSLLSLITGSPFYIFFNVLHVLALGTLLVAALQSARLNLSERAQLTLLVLGSVSLIYLGGLIPELGRMVEGNGLTFFFGILPADCPPMADYLPLIPWLGFFLAGTVIGKVVYPERQSAFPGAPARLLAATRPLEFLGRNSLLFYALHQPVLIGILWALRALGLF
jgi:uncharacterized membrane protein